MSVKHMLTYFSFNIYDACKLAVKRPAEKSSHEEIRCEMNSTNDKIKINIWIGTREKLCPASVPAELNGTAERKREMIERERETNSVKYQMDLKQQNVLQSIKLGHCRKEKQKSQEQYQTKCKNKMKMK